MEPLASVILKAKSQVKYNLALPKQAITLAPPYQIDYQR
jgi:hypothetical protein